MSNTGPPDIGALLTVLRDRPADTTAASDDVLGTIYRYLVKIPPSSDGEVHWFCKHASATTVDAATFSIRLMAYKSEQVDDWKRRLHKCMSACAFCVQGLEMAKVTSQDTFLAAFPKHTLDLFFNEFNKWELQEVLNDLDAVNHLDSSSQEQVISSNSLPIGTLYRLLCNWTIFSDHRILAYLQSRVPFNHVIDWPDYPIPPSLLVLLLVDNTELRSWAAARASSSKIIQPDFFTGHYTEAVDVIVRVMTTSDETYSKKSPPVASIMNNLEFAQSSELWSGFLAILRLIPPQWLKSTVGQPLKLRRVVLSHLHAKENYFAEVLTCFILLVKRLGQETWTEDELEGPQTVLQAIMDNPSYHTILQSPTAMASNLAWIPEYLLTVRGHKAYEEVLKKVVEFSIEVAQQEQFQGVHQAHQVLTFSTRVLYKELKRSQADKDSSQITMVLNIVETYFSTMLRLAHSKSHSDPEWKVAREFAQKLIEEILSADIGFLKMAIDTLCRILGQTKAKKRKDALPTFSFRTQMWKTLYTPIQTPDAITAVVCTVSKIAHIDILKPAVFASQWDFSEGDHILEEINKAIGVFQNGFSASISSFAEYSVSSHAVDILRRGGVGKGVTLLLLSPIQDFQTAGKILAGLAFDVDGRMECFRAMLENYPNEALDGVLEFLANFRAYAPTIPEASSLSAMLVRCFADILEVLCASSNGLLHNPKFLRPNDQAGPSSRMPAFWTSLTKALAIIYNRASMWAAHIDTPDMVLWMRDALILARDVLKQWTVIENASNACASSSSKPATPGKVSSIGMRMIGDLQVFLPELIKWLRLTDEELLHQSFSLLQSLFDLMKETHIRPSDIALEKLNKYVEGAKNTDKSTREQKTRLDRGRLLQLSEVLAHFQEDDNEIVIVSHTVPHKQPVLERPRPPPKSEAELRRYIQGKAHPVKSATRPDATLPFTSTRPSGSKFFTNNDQRKLDSAIAMPSFRKSGTITSSVGTSKTLPDPRRPVIKVEPKNEALDRPAQSSDDSESSSSESDDPGTEAFRKSPKPSSPRKPKQVERRQIKTLDIPIQSNPVQDRLMRNKRTHYNALRLRPDISSLHRIILSWDYNHNSSVPPGKPIDSKSVPGQFDNYDQYFRVFQPLLLMECWAQLQHSKEEAQESYQCKVDSRQYVDDWLDVDISISESVRKEWYLAETDIILLRHPGREKCLMGKVKSYKAAPTGIQATIRCYVQTGTGDPGLQITTLWQVNKVLSLSTLHREYAALVSLQYNDICNFILRPLLPSASEVDSKDLRETMEAYKLNEPQAMAILKTMNMQGFALIQGPPGTGKTSTICGLIARFLSKRSRPAVPIVVGKSASRNVVSEPSTPTGRILVCAPSNAAIDELAQRIKAGYVGSQKKFNPMNIVRIGAEQAMSPGVREISLDYLVDQKLGASPKPFGDIANEIRTIRQEIDSVKQDRVVKIEELKDISDDRTRKLTLENEVKVLNSRRQALITKLDTKKDQQKSDSRTLDTLRRNTRREILAQADIVCSTLSGAGHESLENLEFDLVVIDEAAQAIELSSLIPLKYGCLRCVMVGDPQQLPPTVLSQEASRFGYNQSLFVRLQRSRKEAVHLLSIQYRMHPDISSLPSQVFYGGKLLDGPGMSDKTKQPWHTHAKFGIYKFFNVSWGIEEASGHSIKNAAECNAAVELYNRLHRDFPTINFDFRIGVVSMYKAQIKALRRVFAERFGNDILTKIDFNTVDGFQGQEKDVIILSCVRAGPGLQNVGFLSDIRRMNVALTRAKSSLFVLGNAPTLERSDDTWRRIVQDARSRSALVKIDSKYFDKASSPPRYVEPELKKKAHSTTLSVPAGLSTPQALKAAVEQSISASTSLSHNPVPKAGSSPSRDPASTSYNSIPNADNPLRQNDPTRGTKRPLVVDEAKDVSSRPPNPRIEPPRKRTKQQTMFIPKKRA
ncbi:hypothetical protein GALMADRAFT_220668 [Galerina marginata CBS 339.88]|uniref:Helicase ATP-binding domain-containing protein n=1 Tax=Galerina marginata (strain CBS 339.88) TaxID=685588 RepID=A0A067TUM1_GALM3|nr:hypothetical protein GALMADRAFT_220668 [Galerina marginata CBS 339.88]